MITAEVTKVWTGDFNTPEDCDVIELSLKELIEFGGADKEKLNFEITYDVTELNYAANISMAFIFDKNIVVYQTDLKSVQGSATATFRIPRFLPKYSSQKKVGNHILDIVVKVRPRYSVWRILDNYKDLTELKGVAESSTSRIVTIRP